jgi:hypothetical protein
MEASDEFHGGKVEFAPVVGVEDCAELFAIVRVEFFLREAGEESTDDVKDLRGHADAVFEGNG